MTATRIDQREGAGLTPPDRAASGSLPEVSIVIVNWNSKDFVHRCLRSIYANTRALCFEIIVIDNGSFDGCQEMLAREFPATVFLQSVDNIGFARANNFGARHSHAPYLLFLNPDTEFTEDSVRVLLHQIRMLPRAGALGCRLLNSDGTLQTSCVQSFPTVLNQILDSDFFRARFPRSDLWGTAALYSEHAHCVEVEAISGACLLVKRQVFDRVGGFSEDYFMYGEDLDLCFKISRASYGVYHTNNTNIIHHGGGSSGQSPSDLSDITMRESVRRFLRLNRGAASAGCYRLAMAIAALVRIPLIAALLALGRQRTRSFRKWMSILRWSLGLESRTLANISNTNKSQRLVATPAVPPEPST